MPQVTVSGPLDKANLRDQSGTSPPHFAHLVSRDAAPSRRARGRKIRKWTAVGLERLEFSREFAPNMRREPRPHLAGEPQFLPLVVSDNQRIDAGGSIGLIPADHTGSW